MLPRPWRVDKGEVNAGRAAAFNQGMKYLAAALGLACAAQAAPPVQPVSAPMPPEPDLRQSLRQYHPDRTATPRELTPIERAELRRQLSEQSGGRAQKVPERKE